MGSIIMRGTFLETYKLRKIISSSYETRDVPRAPSISEGMIHQQILKALHES